MTATPEQPAVMKITDDKRLYNAFMKVGEKVRLAFMREVFVYGTTGKGTVVAKGLRAWAGRARSRAAASSTDPAAVQQQQMRKVIERELNLYDPGPRVGVYIAGGHQMMDLYYGQAKTTLHQLRNPAIAEFVHYAMGFKGEFSMKESGRDAYVRSVMGSLPFDQTKPTNKQGVRPRQVIEGWDASSPMKYNGLTVTKEMSRVIRWGIYHFGGTLIFEGKEVYYRQVFDKAATRVGDTDLEAQELFRYFSPGASTVPFGKGRIIFHWGGREAVPTRLHFLSNWVWAKDKTGSLAHTFENRLQAVYKSADLRDIWNRFLPLPNSLTRYHVADIVKLAIAMDLLQVSDPPKDPVT